MSSQVEIVNQGLTLIGDQIIAAMSDDNDRARVATLFFDDMRDAVLRTHPWGFAKTRAELAEAAGTPEFDYTHHFTLPGNCLRVLEVEEDHPGQIEYSIEGRKLLCYESTMKILYIAKVTETGNFDALFCDCLSARLAMAFAMALSKQKTLIEMAARIYEMKIGEAKTVDGLESVRREIYNQTLTGIR